MATVRATKTGLASEVDGRAAVLTGNWNAYR
jgi:hypothetical protein